jgi:hypothetical protein
VSETERTQVASENAKQLMRINHPIGIRGRAESPTRQS